MAAYVFTPSQVAGFAKVRFDTASGSATPATVYPLDYGVVVPGALLTADAAGNLPQVESDSATLYQKTLDYRGVTVTATATLTGVAADAGAGVPGVSAASLSGTYAQVLALTGTGIDLTGTTDSTAALNVLLAGASGKYVRGVPGATYKISAPLILPPGGKVVLDMTGCTVKGQPLDTNPFNLLQNAAFTPNRTVTDGAITSSSATLTSATAAFTSADVGRYVKVAGAAVSGDLLVARILTVTNGTTVTLDTAASTTVSGANVKIHPLDTDITIMGGRWDHLPAGIAGLLDYRDHAIVLRFLERFVVKDMTHTALSGKYCVHVGGARFGRMTGHFFDNAPSDGIHITGPASDIDIRDLNGSTNDDMFVITGMESSIYPYNYNDCIGAISRITGENIHKQGGAARVVYLSPGRSGNVKDIKVRNVSGYATFTGVLCEGDATLTGGTLDDIVIENVNTTSDSGYPMVMFDRIACGKVTIDGVWRQEATSTSDMIQIQGSTITALVARNLRQEATSTGHVLKFQNYSATGSSVDSLTVRDVKLAMPSAGSAIETTGTLTVKELILDGWYCDSTGNSWLLKVNSSTTSITSAKLSRIRWKNASGPSGAMVYSQNGATLSDLFLSDVISDGAYYLLDLGSFTNVWLHGVKIANNGGSLHLSSAAQLFVRGSGIDIGTKTLAIDAGGTIRCMAQDFQCDVSILNNNTAGDRATNTNTGVAPFVAAPAIYDGAKWRSLLTGAVKTGTATLVGGTVTVSDTATTANSVIRVAQKTAGGTPGALYISAKSAGTSFTITSTSGTDTSVVQYDVISY